MRLKDTRNALESIGKRITFFSWPGDMRNRQTRCTLIQYEFSSVDDFGKLLEQSLNRACIGNEIVYDFGPCLVQALIPDAGCEELYSVFESFACLSNVVGALIEHGLAQASLDKVHLVNETEDLGPRTALVQGTNNVGVGNDIRGEFSRLDVEDEDEDSNGTKDVIAGLIEVVFNKTVLAVRREYASTFAIVNGNPYPPQSQRFSIKLPINLILECSTSIVAPSRRTSLAT